MAPSKISELVTSTCLTRKHRFELANAEKLHNKVIQMSKRIRQLEDALQIAQSSVSSSPHPVLSEEYLVINTDIDAPEKTESADQENVFTSFGTLTINEGGSSQFVGRSGSAVSLRWLCVNHVVNF